jgi:hypothetical protein
MGINANRLYAMRELPRKEYREDSISSQAPQVESWLSIVVAEFATTKRTQLPRKHIVR